MLVPEARASRQPLTTARAWASEVVDRQVSQLAGIARNTAVGAAVEDQTTRRSRSRSSGRRGPGRRASGRRRTTTRRWPRPWHRCRPPRDGRRHRRRSRASGMSFQPGRLSASRMIPLIGSSGPPQAIPIERIRAQSMPAASTASRPSATSRAIIRPGPSRFRAGDRQLRQNPAVAGHDTGRELGPADVEGENHLVRTRPPSIAGHERTSIGGRERLRPGGFAIQVEIGRHGAYRSPPRRENEPPTPAAGVKTPPTRRGRYLSRSAGDRHERSPTRPGGRRRRLVRPSNMAPRPPAVVDHGDRAVHHAGRDAVRRAR